MEDNFIYLENENASHRLILLHGWGADAEDLLPFGKALLQDLKFNNMFDLVFLRAPHLQLDEIGRQWYPLFPADWSSASKAVRELQIRLANLPLKKIPVAKTFLFGFSQGAAMAIASGYKFDLAGIIACSAYGHPDWVPIDIKPPMLLTHGLKDEVVPFDAAKKVFELINEKQAHSELFVFTGGHEITPEVINEICSFLKKYI